MAKSPVLFKRSDGFCEGSDGNFAVFMLASDPGKSALTYVPSLRGDPIRIEWDNPDAPIVVLPFSLASGLVRLGYARHLTKDEVDYIVDFGGELVSPPGDKDPDPDPDPETDPGKAPAGGEGAEDGAKAPEGGAGEGSAPDGAENGADGAKAAAEDGGKAPDPAKEPEPAKSEAKDAAKDETKDEAKGADKGKAKTPPSPPKK